MNRVATLQRCTTVRNASLGDDTPYDYSLLTDFEWEGKKLTGQELDFIIKYLGNGLDPVVREIGPKEIARRFTPVVLAALHEVTKDAIRQFQINPRKVIRTLGSIMEGNIQDVCEISPAGISVKDFNTLPRYITAAVSEVHETRNAQGVQLRIKMHDPLAAANALARVMGMNQDKVHLNIDVDLTQRLSLALQRADAPLEIEGELVQEVLTHEPS